MTHSPSFPAGDRGGGDGRDGGDGGGEAALGGVEGITWIRRARTPAEIIYGLLKRKKTDVAE